MLFTWVSEEMLGKEVGEEVRAGSQGAAALGDTGFSISPPQLPHMSYFLGHFSQCWQASQGLT